MRFNILTSAIIMLPVLLSSCNSSKSTESEGEIDLASIDEYKGIANGTVTIGGKVYPVEYTGYAYSKRVFLEGYTDLSGQDTGWYVLLGAKGTITSPQEVERGFTHVTLAYYPRLDSVQCVYSNRYGTITVESFIAKKSGATSYYTTSGKASFTAIRSEMGTYSPIDCPDISAEVTFTKVNISDDGLNQ